MAGAAPIKVYNLFALSAFSQRHKEFHFDGRPILYVETRSGFLQSPQIVLHTENNAGPVVAVSKLTSLPKGIKLAIGNPDAGALWQYASLEGLMVKSYTFDVAGRPYRWTSTHNSALGASRWGSRDFKLVDLGTGQVLMVYVYTQSLFGNPRGIAELGVLVHVGREVEVAAIVAILAIEEEIRRRKSRQRRH